MTENDGPMSCTCIACATKNGILGATVDIVILSLSYRHSTLNDSNCTNQALSKDNIAHQFQ